MTPSPADTDPADPFGTGALRAAALSAWRDSPTRLAEDVAAEAELLQIGYRDRWFTELAANAADAASAVDTPGRMRVHADGTALRVANTGAPLSAAGVRALTALRVSPKKDAPDRAGGAVGRFGVGFRSTGFVDRVELLSVSGSILFDRGATVAAVADALGRTPAAVPGQRLAWPSTQAPSPGYATEAVLHCGDAEQVRSLLAQADAEAPDLLLELPALVEIDVGGTVYRRRDERDHVSIEVDGRVHRRWLRAGAGRTQWLVPVDGDRIRPLTDDVLRSPTPTQIPLSLPARLITDLPVTPDRRGLHPDAEPAVAAAGYPDLVAAAPADQRHLLVPAPAFAAGVEDGQLRSAVLAALSTRRWVPGVDGRELAPERTLVLRGLTPALAELLGEALDPLAHPVVSDGPAAAAVLRLGGRELGLAELADLLSGLDRAPAWWGRLYEALDPLVSGPEATTELGALPIPRADGRLHRGPRGVHLLDLPGEDELVLDWVPTVHPAAHHPLLERLGVARLTLSEVLAHPGLEQEFAAVQGADAYDDQGQEDLADVVLRLLDATDADPVVPAWLGALEVPDTHGDLRPVDELLLPDSPLASVLAEDAPLGVVDPAFVAAYGARPLRRLGAGWGFTLVRDDLPTAPEHDLDAEDRWWDGLPVPPETLRAVRDLELVSADRWGAALDLMAGDPEIAPELADAAGYTVWWLRRFAEVTPGTPLRLTAHPDDDRWRGLFAPLAHPAADALTALLVGAEPDDGDDAGAWLAALADPRRTVAPGVAARAHAAVVAAHRAGRFTLDDLEVPAGLRTLDGSVSADGLIVDQPWWVPVVPPQIAVLAGTHPQARVAADFAALVDAPLASEELSVRVASSGRPLDPDSAQAVRLAATLGWELTGPLVVHDELVVAVFDADDRERRVRVPRWKDDTGAMHVEGCVP